jgi:hypothetical protein
MQFNPTASGGVFSWLPSPPAGDLSLGQVMPWPCRVSDDQSGIGENNPCLLEWAPRARHQVLLQGALRLQHVVDVIVV